MLSKTTAIGEKDQKHKLLMAEGKLDAALCVQQKQARLQR